MTVIEHQAMDAIIQLAQEAHLLRKLLEERLPKPEPTKESKESLAKARALRIRSKDNEAVPPTD